MGRPIKQGLDYFPLDTEWDIKMQLVKARFGLVGIGCIVELYKMIYHEGYALKWDDDTRLLFSADNKIDETELSNIVTFATEKGVFSTDKLVSYGVLTSRGIQKRWLRVARESNRTIKEIAPEILLLDSGSNPIPIKPLSVPIIPLKNELSVLESTHIIGDNRIEKKRKEEYSEPVFEKPPKEVSEPEPDFPVAQGYRPNAGTISSRIETARAMWNSLAPGIGPICRLMAITFKPEDSTDCLRVLQVYTDDEVAEAMRNYSEILQSEEHEVKSRYQSFVGFIRGGVEKFVSASDPWTAYKRALSFADQDEANNKRIIAEVFARSDGG